MMTTTGLKTDEHKYVYMVLSPPIAVDSIPLDLIDEWAQVWIIIGLTADVVI